jgi:LysR family transcriptional regulator, glycine cleavage system transcriptional activator
MALQAAIDGQGVALSSNVLAGDDVAAGRLVRPFDITLGQPRSFAYWLVCPAWRADQPKVKAFRDWLLDEAAAQREAPASEPAQARTSRAKTKQRSG